MSVNNSKRVNDLLVNKKYFVTNNMVFNSKGRIIKGSIGNNGYAKTVLTDKNGEFNATIHQIIWVSANGSYDSSTEINHKDGNKLNNLLENLELVSKSENIKHAFVSGLREHGGTTWWISKLTKENLRDIYRLRKLGWKQEKIAKKFNVNQGSISNVLLGKHYKKEAPLCQ